MRHKKLQLSLGFLTLFLSFQVRSEKSSWPLWSFSYYLEEGTKDARVSYQPFDGGVGDLNEKKPLPRPRRPSKLARPNEWRHSTSSTRPQQAEDHHQKAGNTANFGGPMSLGHIPRWPLVISFGLVLV